MLWWKGLVIQSFTFLAFDLVEVVFQCCFSKSDEDILDG